MRRFLDWPEVLHPHKLESDCLGTLYMLVKSRYINLCPLLSVVEPPHTIITHNFKSKITTNHKWYTVQQEVKENDWHIDVTGIYQNCVLFGLAIRMV
jgi:hypothetical protein